MEENKIAILYIDDEINNLNSFKATFRKHYTIHVADSAEAGRGILKENSIDIIITDQRMPVTTGIEFLSSIISEFPDPIRILLTGYSDIQAVIDAINKGQVYQYISKPWDEQQLRLTIEKAYEVFSLRRENRELLKNLLKANSQLEFLLRQKLLS